MNIKRVIAKELSIPEKMIDEALKVARIHVKVFSIKKKTSGVRTIYHPSKKLKTIQYWLIRRLFNEMPTHESSMAYRDGVSILHNARKHQDSRFFLKMDLEEFFPSITFEDLIPIVRQWCQGRDLGWDLDDEAESIIRRVCFYKGDRLAIGYPSSPVISNIVMNEFDARVNALIADESYGKVVYTRYADDLVFSTDKKGACIDLKGKLEEIIEYYRSPNIKVNNAKTKLGSSTGGSASVTGLKVCADGHITIHRKQKDHIRLLLSLYRKGELSEEEQMSLLGHLGYCHYVAPQFYSKLSNKFFKEIHELRTKSFER